MRATTNARLGATVIAIAPAVLLAGFVYHPRIGNFTDPGFLASLEAAVVADSTRWGLAHLMISVGSGLLALAFLAIRRYLREAGEERWSAPALPFVIVGSTLFALPPAFELTALAAAEVGADVQSFQAALTPWVAPVLLAGAVLFAIGAVGFAIGIVRSRVLDPGLTFAAGALVVMAASRFAPIEVIQFYVQGAAGIIAMWPLAYVIWKHPEARPAGQPRPMPAS